jgi:hypothetical protein
MSTLESAVESFRCEHTDGSPYAMQVTLSNTSDIVSVETWSTGAQYCAYSGRRVDQEKRDVVYFGLDEAQTLYRLLGQVLEKWR